MTPTTLPHIDAEATVAAVRPELLRLLEDLPHPKQIELLNFARYLRQQATATDDLHEDALALRAVRADTLVPLTGLVALGGDAVLDIEALYDGA